MKQKVATRDPRGFTVAEAIIALALIVVLSGAAVLNGIGLLGIQASSTDTSPRQVIAIQKRLQTLESTFYIYAGIKGCIPNALDSNLTISAATDCNDNELWTNLSSLSIDGEGTVLLIRNYIRTANIVKPGYDGTSSPGQVDFDVFTLYNNVETYLLHKTLIING